MALLTSHRRRRRCVFLRDRERMAGQAGLGARGGGLVEFLVLVALRARDLGSLRDVNAVCVAGKARDVLHSSVRPVPLRLRDEPPRGRLLLVALGARLRGRLPVRHGRIRSDDRIPVKPESRPRCRRMARLTLDRVVAGRREAGVESAAVRRRAGGVVAGRGAEPGVVFDVMLRAYRRRDKGGEEQTSDDPQAAPTACPPRVRVAGGGHASPTRRCRRRRDFTRGAFGGKLPMARSWFGSSLDAIRTSSLMHGVRPLRGLSDPP